MIYDGILVLKDGSFRVYVKYQDGVDNMGAFATLTEAKDAWKAGHLAWNHCKRKRGEAPIYDIQLVETTIRRPTK